MLAGNKDCSSFASAEESASIASADQSASIASTEPRILLALLASRSHNAENRRCLLAMSLRGGSSDILGWVRLANP